MLPSYSCKMLQVGKVEDWRYHYVLIVFVWQFSNEPCLGPMPFHVVAIQEELEEKRATAAPAHLCELAGG